MKKSYLIPGLIAALFLNVSCVEDVEEQVPSERCISFTPEFEGATRATDTYFETGDEISVYALKGTTLESSGNYADNVRYSYVNYKFIPTGKGIELDEGGLNFVAFYPYNPDYSDNFSYTVAADQSTHEAYTGSDFMFAVGSTVAETSVALKFRHSCSKIVIDISDADLPSGDCYIELSDVATKATYDINNLTYQTADQRGYIKMCPDGSNRFKAIIAPQTLEGGEIIGTLLVGYNKYIIRMGGYSVNLEPGQEGTFYLLNSGNEYVLATSKVNNNNIDWFKQTLYLEDNPNNDTYKYNCLHVLWESEYEITSMRYGMYEADASTTYSDSEIIEYLKDASDEYISYINDNGYLGIYYSGADPDTEYEMITYVTGIVNSTTKSVMKRNTIRTAKQY